MKTKSLSLLLLAIVLSGCAWPNIDPVVARTWFELDMLEGWSQVNGKSKGGAWQVVKFVDSSGKVTTEDEIKGWTYEFKDNRMTSRRGNHQLLAARYTIDPLKQPEEINIFTRHGPYGVVAGIYKIDGDELILCWAADFSDGKVMPRPTELKARVGYELLTLKRVKTP